MMNTCISCECVIVFSRKTVNRIGLLYTADGLKEVTPTPQGRVIFKVCALDRGFMVCSRTSTVYKNRTEDFNVLLGLDIK